MIHPLALSLLPTMSGSRELSPIQTDYKHLVDIQHPNKEDEKKVLRIETEPKAQSGERTHVGLVTHHVQGSTRAIVFYSYLTRTSFRIECI